MVETLIKTFEDSVHTHIYTYALTERLMDYLNDVGLIVGVDYDTDVFLYGKIFKMTHHGDDEAVLGNIDKIISEYEITKDDFIMAAKKVAIEIRQREEIDDLKIDCAVTTINGAKFQKLNRVFFHESVEGRYRTPKNSAVRFRKRANNDFAELGLQIKIDGCPDELRAMAAVVIDKYKNALWQSLRRRLGTAVYDAEEWIEGKEAIGVTMRFVGLAKNVQGTDLPRLAAAAGKKVIGMGFAKKMRNRLLKRIYDLSNPALEDELISRSGIVMGGEGWAKVVELKNIQTILEKLKLDSAE
jgi:hypothetical protein